MICSIPLTAPPPDASRHAAAGGGVRRATGFQARLALIFVILTSAPLLIVLLASHRIALDHGEALIRERSLAVASATAAALDAEIARSREAFLAAALDTRPGASLPPGPLGLVATWSDAAGFSAFRSGDDAGRARRRLPDADAVAAYRGQARTGDSPITLSPPLGDRDGAYFHLVTELSDGRLAIGVLDGGFVARLQAAARFGERGQAAILDAAGRAIADPRAGPELATETPPFALRPHTATDIAPGVVSVEAVGNGTAWLGAQVTVPGTGWTVAIVQPRVALQSEAWRDAAAQYYPTLAMIGLCCLLACALAREIVKPIRRVTDVAEKIAAGDFAQRVGPITSPAREFEVFGAALDRMIGELTRQNAELERIAAEAQAANTAKSLFLASVSHELRTPINGVIGLIDAVREVDPDRDRRALLDTAAGSARTLNRLLSHILDLSRMEHGQLRLEPRAFAPRALFAEVGQLFDPEAARKGLRFELDLSATLPDTLVADPDRLRHLLFNLIANAVKFTETGSVRVSAGTGPGATGEELRIEVADTGPGIPAAVQARVFDRFFQADGSYDRRHGGLGLGLAISRRLVDLMGGTIRFTSAPKTGTVFTLAIPVARAPAGAEQEREDG